MKRMEIGPTNVNSWCPDIEDGAMEQITNLCKLPFLAGPIAIMPDCHQGFGMPIGGVIATNFAVLPSSVGSDIGCGMHVVQTCLTDIGLEDLKTIMGKIRLAIPTGFNHHKDKHEDKMPYHPYLDNICQVAAAEYQSASHQVGTLGGGNHFIEIQKSKSGWIYFMIHSGSRNLGKKVCDHYNGIAKELNKKWYSNIDPKWDLAFLPYDTEEGQAYVSEMEYCLSFAKNNRQFMADMIKEIFVDVTKTTFVFEHDIHHNYMAIENHFGKNVFVHRKGATSAYETQIGIIPGSQGTKSYIVQGKGNIHSYKSCSHGAGRKMGRKEASRTLKLAEEIKKLDDQGIVHSIRTIKDLDEATGAYKDISEVISQQLDLIEVVTELTPLGVIKGD